MSETNQDNKTRRAVGAIVKYKNGFLLVHKVKVKNFKNGPEKIMGEWDFPKGGVKGTEAENEVMRELREETGSNNYRIIKQFDEKIRFEFPPEIREKIGFDKQETLMFLIEYLGDCSELRPQDDEIDDVRFFDISEVLEKLTHKEVKNFFIKNILIATDL